MRTGIKTGEERGQETMSKWLRSLVIVSLVAGPLTTTTAGEPAVGDADAHARGKVSGRLIVPDQKGLPPGSHVTVYSRRKVGNADHAHAGVSPVGKDGRFAREVPRGDVRIVAEAPGFAVALLGPFPLRPGEEVSDLEIKLTRGFTGQVQLRSKGRKQPGVGVVTASLTHALTAGWGIKVGEFRFDARGQARILRCPSIPLDLQVRASPFEHREFKGVALAANKVGYLDLTPAVPSRGKVLSSATGKPIRGARLKIVWSSPPADVSHGGCGWSVGRGPVWARSDDQGRVSLDVLRKDWDYWFEVSADGFAPRLVGPFQAGKGFGEVKLAPPIEVSGEIRASPEVLKRVSGRWHQTFTTKHRGSSSRSTTPCGESIHTRVRGERIPFRITGLHKRHFSLQVYFKTPGLKNQEFKTELKESIRGLIITPTGVHVEPTVRGTTRPARGEG